VELRGRLRGVQEQSGEACEPEQDDEAKSHMVAIMQQKARDFLLRRTAKKRSAGGAWRERWRGLT
jgi:hypothetical protein